MHLYKFAVLPGNGSLPRDFCEYLIYLWRKNPFLWFGVALVDIVHYSRFPVCYAILGRIIDVLRQSTPGHGVPDQARHLLYIMLIVLIVGEMAHVWLSMVFIYWRPKLRASIRADFLDYAMGHSHTYFQDNFAGSLTRKISEVAEGTVRLHDIIRNQVGYSLIQIGSISILLFLIRPIYALGTISFMLAICLPVIIRLPRIRARSKKFSSQRSHVNGTIVDIFSNMSAVRMFAAQSHENNVHAEQSGIEQNRAIKLIRNMVQIEHLRRVCIMLLAGGMAVFACYGWAQGWLTVGEASSVATLSIVASTSAWTLGNGIILLVDEVGNISESLEISFPHALGDTADAQTLKVKRAAIDFRNVGFGYKDSPLFENLDMSIHPGEKIALIGPSGAGKTSFVNLLLRLYDIDGGKILIDGQDTSLVTQDSLRENISVIPQDTALFHRTLMENIRYGRRDAADAEVFEASKRAHADEFISKLSDGYNTMVGERGIKLSGGQRQRIAIARAILKDAPILILDEATSALDSESELVIQEALAELMTGKTVIAIAHRLSTIARMDRILVFDQGKIIEAGPHNALLAQNGLYARLWAMQSGGFLQDGA